MEFYLTILVGLIFAASTYLMQSRSVIRLVLGVALLGNAVNLLIFTVGRVTRDIPPIIPKDFHGTLTGIANPLPQALILTAIVIGFALFSFVLVLKSLIFSTERCASNFSAPIFLNICSFKSLTNLNISVFFVSTIPEKFVPDNNSLF
ncbi:MAG: hypothetical protein COB73_09330 [Flavobacteriaceae bacterium]|nr:MAG: hypothetical protein COB73_09330 [Flavobacteriaceae bacterium]